MKKANVLITCFISNWYGSTFVGLSKEERYKLWLNQQYQTVIDKLLELLHHKSTNIEVIWYLGLCLVHCMFFTLQIMHNVFKPNVNYRLQKY